MPGNKHTNTKHHSQNKAEQIRFMTDVTSLLSTIEQYGNPFEDESPYLVTLVSKSQLDEQATQTVKRLAEIGKIQYSDFLSKRLQSHEINFYEPVKMNKLNIFKEQSVRKVSALTVKNKMLRNDCELFSRLYLGATNRKVDLDQFFNYENQPFPPSISNNGHLRNGPKSNIVDCLRDEYQDADLEDLDYGSHDDATAFVVDGAVIVHFINSTGAKTFGEYSSKIRDYFRPFTQKYQRIDIVWDVYRENTIKRHAREKRGTGRIQKVASALKLPQKWVEFLKVDENKNRLFKLLAQDIVKIDAPDCLIVTNVEQNVLTLKEHDTSRIEPSNHEETDTRLFVHVKDAVLAGRNSYVLPIVMS
ncbi:uncharacterized protein LOC119067048 [Bradysia coprophila]|uniref:uncharacterized protein LOC119067048 n=1 Tax=Bradysia coprophila TaxID=38358 RepID=UPI00187DC5CB|nr:uncharacterized protein LOC119067048 [Bradysia coprophila]XP_037025688.1 uncharacterized protein LOC119067048 [Bradysia coprophila]